MKAVHVSACGNFGIAANERGVVGVWNLQSGIRRKTFVLPSSLSKEKEKEKEKEGDDEEKVVVGLACDALNQVLVVATLSGKLHVSPLPSIPPNLLIINTVLRLQFDGTNIHPPHTPYTNILHTPPKRLQPPRCNLQ